MYVDRLTLVGGKRITDDVLLKYRWPEEEYRAAVRLTQDSSSRKGTHLRLMDRLFEDILCDRPLIVDGKYVPKPGAVDCVASSAGWIGYIAHHHKDMPWGMHLGSVVSGSIHWYAVNMLEGDDLAKINTGLSEAVHWLLDGAIQSTSAVAVLETALIKSFNRNYPLLCNIQPSPSPAVLTCPECPHWGLMTGRCSKTGPERGSGDVCNLPKGGTNVR